MSIMKKVSHLFMIIILMCAIFSLSTKVDADSISSDKREIVVDLEVSGAEALCQTEDGFVWIGQYSGLVRYDSNEYVVYKEFYENGQKYEIINIRDLVNIGNTLFILTNKNFIKYENNTFHMISNELGTLVRFTLDEQANKIYIAKNDGIAIYDVENDTFTNHEISSEEKPQRVAKDKANDIFYYSGKYGVYNQNDELIYESKNVLDIYAFDDILYIGEADGDLFEYDLTNKVMLDESYKLGDQINALLYNALDKVLYVACEADGIYCVYVENGHISLMNGLENNSQIIDLMIDYEGNLWLASHYIGSSSGVSIITKNSLISLFFEDAIWQSLGNPPKSSDRNVYAVEKIGDILYVCSTSGIYFYDTNQKKILASNPVMVAVKAYAESKSDITYYDFRDVEEFNGKIYFASMYIGLIEYNPNTDDVVIYDKEYIGAHSTVYNNASLEEVNLMRCLRRFDNYLAIGCSRGSILRFDGTNFLLNTVGGNALYINSSATGSMIVDTTGALYEISSDFSTFTHITTSTTDGYRLKFLIDGDYIYYTLNSRLIRTKKVNDEYVHEEITIPHVKGSIVELSKVKINDKYGNSSYKYVIASENQLYIVSSIEDGTLKEFELYDKTNGLDPIKANTSGYYDEATGNYYLQSTNGVFVYSFNESRDASTPLKMAINSIDLDGKQFYGNEMKINKKTSRVVFNLSILGFRPNKGYTVYYKLNGVDKDYNIAKEDSLSVSYTNLKGGTYDFYAYVVDEYGQQSNVCHIHLVKDKFVYEQVWFWVLISFIGVAVIALLNFGLIKFRMRASIRRQLEYKNITLEAIQAIARTIDAKDEYTNGHSIRVGYYSKVIAQNLGLEEEKVNNIYYIALLHDIGKIAIPDSILNKPGRLTDEEFMVMKSHTTRGAKILNGISTIPQIIEGAKSHHERWDGKGYPEGLSGEFIPFVARIICCADCFDAMASKRVYKEPFSLEKIISEFEKCSGTQFDPKIAALVVELIKDGKLKPYTAENTYLGSDGKTYRIKKDDSVIEAKSEE